MVPRPSEHVDLFRDFPLEGAPSMFMGRLPLDDPALWTSGGEPSQIATGRATYYHVSEPHTLADCPHKEQT